MTKSKRAFAEMYAAAQGREGDTSLIDELCEKYTMIEIIYEMKKYEEDHKEPEPEPPKEPEAEPPKEPEPEPPKEPEPEPPKEPEPAPPKEQPRMFDFWSRLSSED
jgi:hypothetical protein